MIVIPFISRQNNWNSNRDGSISSNLYLYLGVIVNCDWSLPSQEEIHTIVSYESRTVLLLIT